MTATQTETKAPAAKPRDTLNPAKISGAYIVALLLNITRAELVLVEDTRLNETRVYKMNGRFYCVPQRGKAPPAGPFWRAIGSKYGRTAYKAAHSEKAQATTRF